ncbi:MAG: hypothetical protein JO112_07610, partial [Planctomycetes bacterium]|nr:hypothetical protein [Planctomycetota bacterium]
PAGNVAKDLGTGHVSLEPALLATLKMTPDDYLQGESAYWIPIGGDPNQEGNIWHNHFSWNHVLWRANANVQVVGTLEANSWIILNGLYTVDLAPAPMSTGPGIGGNAENFIMSTGPGIRVFICDKLDLGVGSAFSITGARWAEELIRTELRLRF